MMRSALVAPELAGPVALLKRALAERGATKLLLFLVASLVHALGHAALALVASGLSLGLVQAWQNRVASVSAGATPYASYADKALSLSAFGLAAVFVKGAAGVYATYVQRSVAAEVGNGLRLALLDALLGAARLRTPGHDDHSVASSFCSPSSSSPSSPSPPPSPRTSRLPPLRISAGVSALTEQIRDVELGFQQGLLGGARAAAQLGPLIALLFVLSQRMALVSVGILAVFGVGLGRARSAFRGASHRVAAERERLLEAADECVRHADLWVTYGAEHKARASVRRLGDALARGAAILEARAAAMTAANEILGACALVAALGAARAGWLGEAQEQGELLAFSVAFFLTYRPLRDLAEARLAWTHGAHAYDRLWSVALRVDPVPSSHGLPSGSPAQRRSWSLETLEIRGVRLARGSNAALSIRIEPGTVVAICGATGTGKTTLLRTLLGLEPALAGEIAYGGELLSQAPAGPGARPFAWVPQDAPLLTDSLAANVTLGVGAPSDAASASAEALRAVGAPALASHLGEERLGAGGRAISGGERQWVALARAVATMQPVLLLDEPTSGLDPESQRQALDAIGRLRGHRTVILVSHRSEPIAIADAVVRLGEGGALERAA